VAADVPDPMTAAWWRRRLRAVAEVVEAGRVEITGRGLEMVKSWRLM
jgi:hypothetical protein